MEKGVNKGKEVKYVGVEVKMVDMRRVRDG